MADGQVKLFAAMLHEDGVIIAQHRIPDDTNEITQVRQLLDPVDLTDAVITADAAHARHDTAGYLAGERDSDYLLQVTRDRTRALLFLPYETQTTNDFADPVFRTSLQIPAR